MRRSWLAASAVAALVCLSLAAWIVVNASGLAVTTPGHSTTPVARTQPTHTPTAAPTATATVIPTATPQVTATETPQQRLDAQAENSLRAVTLGRFVDGSCSSGNNVTQFGQGQTIYFNFCTSGAAVSGPLSVSIRQNGSVVYNLNFRQYLSPGASYYCYSSYGFAPGTYDALVTLQVNGQPATARDIQFTIG